MFLVYGGNKGMVSNGITILEWIRSAQLLNLND